MKSQKYLSTAELAKILGISRIAVYKKIKSGKIKAERIGRDFFVNRKDLDAILGKKLSAKEKSEIEKAVKKTVKEYGETLKLLGST